MTTGTQGPDHRMDERLRRGMRPGGLSARQRQRHLDQISAQGAWEMDFVRQRSMAEFGVVAAVLLVVAAIGVWQFGLLGSGSDDNLAGADSTPTVALAEAVPTNTPVGGVAAAPSNCEITPFADRLPPDYLPANYPLQPALANWYGSDNLWAGPPNFDALSPPLPETSHYWFSGAMPVIWSMPSHDLPEITARHLSDPGATFSYEFQDTVDPAYTRSVVEFSEEGCWEVHASSADGELTFTIDVQPIQDRPDMIYQYEQWQLSAPFGVPSSCDTTEWTLEDRSGILYAQFWLNGDGISAWSNTGLFWQDSPNRIFWTTSDNSTDIALSGWLQSDPAIPMDISSSITTVTSDPLFPRQLNTELVFPESGCWTVQAQSGDTTAEFTVFVYPTGETPGRTP